MERKSESGKNNEIESARIGYQVASNLIIYEGNTLWSKFNSLLVANSIVLGAIVLSTLSTSESSLIKIFSIGMPILGIILCMLWFLLTKRSFKYYEYWIFSAREMEERYLSSSVKTLSRGGNFADGKDVKIKIADNDKTLQTSFLGRLPVKCTSYMVISLFFGMYVAILVMSISC